MREGWQEVQLGEVITLQYGKPLNEADRSPTGEFPAFGANGILCRSTKSYQIGPSIIVGRKGSAGEVTLVEEPFWPTDVTYFVEHDQTVSDLKFIYHLLKSLQLQALAKGVKPGINRNDVYAIPVPLPPLAEQKRIVAILDEAFEGINRAIANTRQNLANARELFERTVTERIFGDADTKGWVKATVADVAAPTRGSIRTGPFGSQLLHSEFVDNGVAVLGIDNAVENEFLWQRRRFVTQEKYEALVRYTVKPGDVLITIMGTCGRCAVVPDDIPVAINTKHLCCITLDGKKCDPYFLHAYFLHHPLARGYLQAQAKGSIMAGLNMGLIQELPLRLPIVDEQVSIANQIAELKEDCRRLTSGHKQKLASLAELKQSLLARAFSGELTAADELQEAAE